MGTSFATKHIKFWGKFPILDTRLNLILTGATRFMNYQEFVSILKNLAKLWNCNILEAERAIFAFSQHFFLNEKLSLKSTNLDKDIDFFIAKKISDI